MFSIFVTLKIKRGFSQLFIEASRGDATGSVRDEQGCFRFDIHQNSLNSNTFHLYEVYLDEAAFKAHIETPHYLKWQSAVKDWFDGEPSVIRMDTVFPSQDGWEQQKTHLLSW